MAEIKAEFQLNVTGAYRSLAEQQRLLDDFPWAWAKLPARKAPAGRKPSFVLNFARRLRSGGFTYPVPPGVYPFARWRGYQ